MKSFDEEMRAAAEGYLLEQKVEHKDYQSCMICKAKLDAYLAGSRAALKSELMREVREALKRTEARLSGMAMTTFPINVRELDGSISTVRPKSAAGEAYDDVRQALTALERAGEE